jgi:hypothetical protein
MKRIKPDNITVLLSTILLFMLSASLPGQELSKAELEERARKQFEDKQYEKAAADYKVLQGMFPKENRYNYYLGLSYLNANMELASAVELLKKTATRNYGSDTYFHLGRAYHRTYQFDQAAHAMTVFKKTAREKDIRRTQVDRWLKTIENARKAVLVAQKLSITDMQEVPGKSPESAFKDKIGGKYVYVPEEFLTQADRSKDYQSLMYLSDEIQPGDYLYFACRSKGGRSGTDICRVKRITTEDFSLPEVLQASINSTYDEAFPYFDKSTSTLYFSSNNDQSIGGYDIFKSRYNTADQSWSKPEKLDFPVNSVHDDFLYTPTATGGEVIFLSSRSSRGPDFHAYTYIPDSIARYEIPSGREEVMTLALLMPSGIEIDHENFRLAQFASSTDTEEAVPENTGLSEYEILINEAVSLQSKSDSLVWMAAKIKAKAVESEHYREKQARTGSIAAIETEAKRNQQLADEKFTQAEALKPETDINSLQQGQFVQEQPATENGLVPYSYDPSVVKENSDEAVRQGSREAAVEEQGREAAGLAHQEIMLGFSITQASPYSSTNPIPEAVLPSGLVYRIQLGSFSNMIPENTFGGLSPLSREPGVSGTRYYVGYFKSVTDARKALNEVKEYGYPDAFIVSFYKQEKIPIQKAREIEFAGKQF